MTDEASEFGLEAILVEAAADLDGVQRLESGDEITWLVDGRPFAVAAGGRAEFRLDPLVARAALRTAATSTSPRGPEWVAFAPAALVDEAVDRAEAWLLSGYRRARTGQ